jgi:hypothetical protein
MRKDVDLAALPDTIARVRWRALLLFYLRRHILWGMARALGRWSSVRFFVAKGGEFFRNPAPT